MTPQELKNFLDEQYERYHHSEFIEDDPVGIAHGFSKKEDIEIAAFLSATIAWGKRAMIIKNASLLMDLMDQSPYEYICDASNQEMKRLENFKHRTFNGDDLRHFVNALRNIYANHGGLEKAFSQGQENAVNTKAALIQFHHTFFEIPHLERTKKHVSNPAKGSAAKRLNMFLRWMVRDAKGGVDFGLWKTLSPAQLSCPLDIHSGNTARKLGILKRKQNDWKAVEELDAQLRLMDPIDPVKYDFALFGLGVYGDL